LSNCNKLLCLTSINIQFLFFSYICDHSYIIPYKSRLMVMFQRAQLKQNDIKGLIWPSVKVWGTIMVFPAKEAGCWYIIRGMETLVFFLGFEETSLSRKAYFVGSGEGVKPRLSQALTRDARPDSNSRPAVQISNHLSSRYAPWKRGMETPIQGKFLS